MFAALTVAPPAAATTGPQGNQGPAGVAGTPAPTPIVSTSTCTTKVTSLTATTTTCTLTYTYGPSAAKDLVNGARVNAIGKISGRLNILASGRIHGRKVALTAKHLRRGLYRVTLVEIMAHGHKRAIGRLTIVIR